MTKEEKQRFCRGCREDFYNHNPGMNGKPGCWNLAKAKVVRRWKLEWWTAPTVPGAYEEVKTLNCHREPGRYAFHANLPAFAVDPHRMKRGKL